jgi:energy-coupling factor transporter transmembrane protein EcfT
MIASRHPLAKLVAFGLLVLTASVLDGFAGLGLIGGVLLVVLLGIERRPWRLLLRRMGGFAFLAVGMSWIYLVAENPAYTPVAGHGAWTAATVAARILTMGLASLAFAETTRADDLARSLEQNAGLPRRLVQGVLAAIQFLPALADDYRMLRLLQPRGDGSVGARLRAGLAAVSPDVLLVLFAGALRRAGAAALSMQMRGLGPHTAASAWRRKNLRQGDLALVAGAVILAASASVLR